MTLRGKLIRLAHENPELREHLLPIIKEAMDFPSEDAWKAYKEKHPGAERADHNIKKQDSGGGKKEEEPKEKPSDKGDKKEDGGKGKKDPKQPIKVDKRLNELLGQWHSSASDPIYAVSSNAYGGNEVPRETIEKARDKVDNWVKFPKDYRIEKADVKGLQKAKKILDSMLK